MEELKPIEYPKITVPGRGTFEVKYGLAAARIIDRELGMSSWDILPKLNAALPKPRLDGKGALMLNPDGTTVMEMGVIGLDFMLTLLAACLSTQLKITAEELAIAFDSEPIAETTAQIVGALITAVSKTKWSAQPRLQATATPAQEPATPVN